MERYDFKVRGAEGAISIVHSAALSDLRSVWSVIAEIARNVEDKGGRIVVTNDAGEVVILIGVATARGCPPARREPNIVSISRNSAIHRPSSPGTGERPTHEEVA